MNKMEFDLENRDWKEFTLNDIFEIDKGVYLNSKNIIEGNNPFISAKSVDNGVTSFIGNETLFSGNSITVEKIKLSAFYQPTDFYCSHDVTVLKNNKLNKYNAKFICNAINRNGSKYSYGRQAQMNVVKREKIFLPVLNDKPDYKFMEQFIRHKEQEKLNEYKQFIQKRIAQLKNTPKTVSLNEKEWGEFFIEEIAQILPGRDIYARERFKGETPYVSATANQNGIGYFVGNNNKTLESNCLSVNRNGSVGYSFYHPYKALFGNDCRKLRLNNPSKYIGIFISQQITRQKGKYGYGYKMGTARLKRQKIMLPINQNSEPDYEFMKKYIKNLEYKKLTEYLKFKKE